MKDIGSEQDKREYIEYLEILEAKYESQLKPHGRGRMRWVTDAGIDYLAVRRKIQLYEQNRS